MDRSHRHTLPCRAAGLLLAALMLAQTGCTGVLATGAYLLGANNTPAEFSGLKGKKVAVVCRPSPQLEFSSKRAAMELAAELAAQIKKKVPRTQLIPQDQVRAWTDENQWEEYTQVGKAVGADMVVAVDLDRFTLYQSQTLYRGTAEFVVRVYDMQNGGTVAYEKAPAPVVYPPSTGIYTQDKTEPQFRRQFVRVLADRIARVFYSNDPRDTFAQDSTALLD